MNPKWPNMSPHGTLRASNKTPNANFSYKNECFVNDFGIQSMSFWSPLGHPLGSPFAVLGSHWAPIGLPLGSLWAPLRPLASSWASVEPSWAPLGLIGASLGSNLVHFGSPWKPQDAPWDPLGSILNICSSHGFISTLQCTIWESCWHQI